MSGSPIDRYLGKGAAQAGETDSKSLGFETAAEPPCRMLDLVYKNGDHEAVPYSYLVGARLKGGGTVELEFPDRIVTLRGRNLNAFYQHVLAQTARRVTVSDTGFDDEQCLCWFESIVVDKRD